MKKDWQKKKLDEVCEVEYGTRVVQKRDGGTIYPVYGGGGATFSMDSFNREDRVVVARFGMSEQCTRFVAGKFFLNDSGLTLSPKNSDTLLPTFLDKWLFSGNDEIFAIGKGTAQKNLDVAAFRCLQVPQPPLPEQKRIVDILDKAFAAISTAKANAEKNLQNARELFESYLQDVFANAGDGWEEKKLNDVCEVKDGTHYSPQYVPEGIPFVTQKNITENGLDISNTKRISLADHESFYKRSNVFQGDIIISMIGANRGMACLVNESTTFSIKNVGLVKANPKVNQDYLLYFLKSPKAKEYVSTYSKGGAQEFIGLTELRKFPVLLATLPEQKRIVAKLDALSSETKKLEAIYQQKIADLEELKKSVLQKAFNGGL
ncbi:MAG: restriction endonuclease subunit S [Sedimentisphaerales bacterium]